MVLRIDAKTGKRTDNIVGYSVEWTSSKLSLSSAIASQAAGRVLSDDMLEIILFLSASQLISGRSDEHDEDRDGARFVGAGMMTESSTLVVEVDVVADTEVEASPCFLFCPAS